MNVRMRIAVFLGLALGLVPSCVQAQEMAFFRIVSTQQTCAVSIDATGLLVWSNSIPGAACEIEVKGKLDGVWTNNFPMSPISTNGCWTQTRVPMCRVLDRWIVAFQPTVTLAQAQALFDANNLIWQPLAWDNLRMATICLPHSTFPPSAVTGSPDVRYVEADIVMHVY